MSIIHVAWALEQRTKNPSEKLVLICLAEAANVETGECWPSQATIARRCAMGRTGVNRILARLEEAGFIQSERRTGPNGEGMPSVYRLRPCETPVLGEHTPCAPGALVKATGNNPPKVPRSKKQEQTYADWAASLEGDQALPAEDPIWRYMARVGLPREFLRLAWLEFRHRHTTGTGAEKRQKDWRQTFRNYVERNYLKLWFLDAGEFRLTSVGAQAQKFHERGDE